MKAWFGKQVSVLGSRSCCGVSYHNEAPDQLLWLRSPDVGGIKTDRHKKLKKFGILGNY